MKNFSVSIELKKGDIIDLFESGIIIRWPVNENQSLTIKGDVSDGSDEKSICNYRVIAPCITVPKDAFQTSLFKMRKSDSDEWQNGYMLPTCTDIGGHYLMLIRNNNVIEQYHLHNGFGDGMYHLRFINGVLAR